MQTTTFLDFLHHLYDLLAPTASSEEMLRLTHALGQVYQSLGQLEEAVSWHRRHLELATSIPDSPAQITAHYELGELALVANDHQAAVSAARAGLGIDIPAEDSRRMALIARGHRLLGAALAMEGSDLAAAESHLQEAVASLRLTPCISHKRGVFLALATSDASRRRGVMHSKPAETWDPAWGAGNNAFQVLEAEAHLDAALATAQQQGRRLLLMQGERLYARLLAARGDWPKANDLFAHALERASDLDLPLEIARTQAAWGESLVRYASQPDNGRALLAQAREVFIEYDAGAELKALTDTLR